MSAPAVTRHFRLKSDLAAIEPLCTELRRLLVAHHLPDSCFQIELLAREIFTNAAQHGNRLDPQKWVECAVCLEGDTIEICMRDEGAGFDWREELRTLAARRADGQSGGAARNLFDDVFTAENLIDVSGRGLSICQRYADEFFYNDLGTEVTLRKKLTSSPCGPAGEGKLAPTRVEYVMLPERLCITLHGSLVAGHTEVLSGLTDAHTDQNGPANITIDLAGTVTIDSTGMSALIAIRRSCLQRGGYLRLINVPRHILDLFTSVNLDRILEIENDHES